MNEQQFAELAAGYALHALSPDDEAAFETARREHPEWENHVTADLRTSAMLAGVVPGVAPPPSIRDALMAGIGGVAAPVPGTPPRDTAAPTSSRGRRARRWFVLAASLALLVGAGWGAVVVGQQLNRPPSIVALEEIRSAPDAQSETAPIEGGGRVTAHWSPSVGEVVLVAEGLPAIGADRDFELWFVRDGTAIAAGLMAADDRSATAVLEGAMEPGDVVAVTVEPAGGSPTGRPTSEPIVAIPIT